MYDFLGYFTLALIPGFIVLDLIYRQRRYDTPRSEEHTSELQSH